MRLGLKVFNTTFIYSQVTTFLEQIITHVFYEWKICWHLLRNSVMLTLVIKPCFLSDSSLYIEQLFLKPPLKYINRLFQFIPLDVEEIPLHLAKNDVHGTYMSDKFCATLK